jgi:hypothetical protein
MLGARFRCLGSNIFLNNNRMEVKAFDKKKNHLDNSRFGNGCSGSVIHGENVQR